LRFDTIVYGDIEYTYVYDHDEAGAPRRAEIVLPDEDPAVMELD
jgi:hypothetical protein